MKLIDKESFLDFIGVGNGKINEKKKIFFSYIKVRSRYFLIRNRNLLYDLFLYVIYEIIFVNK